MAQAISLHTPGASGAFLKEGPRIQRGSRGAKPEGGQGVQWEVGGSPLTSFMPRQYFSRVL